MTLLFWSVCACSLPISDNCDAATYVAWGAESTRWQAVVPTGAYRAVALGGYHALILAEDGTLHAWGDNYYGQCEVPSTGRFVAVAAGRYHSLALRNDGTIVVWGDNTRHQCRSPVGSGFVAVGAGDWHSLAIRSDGSLQAWGYNEHGQCNIPTEGRFRAVAGGCNHSVALSREGAIVAWGSNEAGQCNAPAGQDFVAIAAGAFHNLALRSDHSLATWGRNDFGQCNIPAGNEFVAIAAGAFHGLALKEDGTVVAWGLNNYGQCRVPDNSRATAIVAGGYTSVGLMVPAPENGPLEQLSATPNASAKSPTEPDENSETAKLDLAPPETDTQALCSAVTAAPSPLVEESVPDASGTAASRDDANAPNQPDVMVVASAEAEPADQTRQEETGLPPQSEAETPVPAIPAAVPSVALNVLGDTASKEQVRSRAKDDAAAVPETESHLPVTAPPDAGDSTRVASLPAVSQGAEDARREAKYLAKKSRARSPLFVLDPIAKTVLVLALYAIAGLVGSTLLILFVVRQVRRRAARRIRTQEDFIRAVLWEEDPS